MLQKDRTFIGSGVGDWRLVINTAPTVNLLTSAEVKLQTRVEHSADDTLIASIIAGVTAHLDGAQGWLGRCLCEQTWDLKLDRFPYSGFAIRLPLPPLISVGSITYVDEDGATQTWASSKYTVSGVGAHSGGYVEEAYEEGYPDTRDVPEAVTITFTAGYANTNDSPPQNTVPAAIKHAALLMAGDLYKSRESTAPAALQVQMPTGIKALLEPYRHRTAM